MHTAVIHMIVISSDVIHRPYRRCQDYLEGVMKAKRRSSAPTDRATTRS